VSRRRAGARLGVDRAGQHTLIAAPTGSGKTLAAFLIAIDELVRESLDGPLPDEVRVLYVSPLKALSTDIHKNLEEPRTGSRHRGGAGAAGAAHHAAVRTGDTTPAARAAMVKTPPHILVTTPSRCICCSRRPAAGRCWRRCAR
jgi:ATP-dependent Lhr-like helicase